MTKRHFIAIANILNLHYQKMIWPKDRANFKILVDELMDMFESENKLFKPDVFIKAVYKN